MSTRRDRNAVNWSLPPLLIRVIHAARHASSDAVDSNGHAAVLTDLGRWALVTVPSRGVLAPADDAAYKIIQESAVRHLRYGEARQALRNALLCLKSLEQRDGIESAQNLLPDSERRRILLRWLGVRDRARSFQRSSVTAQANDFHRRPPGVAG